MMLGTGLRLRDMKSVLVREWGDDERGELGTVRKSELTIYTRSCRQFLSVKNSTLI
jgi:hypothetical protein